MPTAYPSVFFEAPYHFYILPLPDFPFLPERQFLFYRHMFRFISCSAHIRYSSPALIFFANLLAGPNRQVPLC